MPDSAGYAPRTPVEAVVAAIWRQVLGRSNIGMQDNFYELGGHSLLVGEVVSRINPIFHVDLSLLSMVEAPTVEELAKCIEAVYRMRNSQATRCPQAAAPTSSEVLKQ